MYCHTEDIRLPEVSDPLGKVGIPLLIIPDNTFRQGVSNDGVRFGTTPFFYE